MKATASNLSATAGRDDDDDANKKPAARDGDKGSTGSMDSEEGKEEGEGGGNTTTPTAPAGAAASSTTASTGTRRINARTLNIHKIPQFLGGGNCKFDLPHDMLNKQNYDPRIDFSTEQELYVVAYLGAGGNGDVWFAVTTDFKRCCAVKFFNSSGEYSKRQLAQMEANN